MVAWLPVNRSARASASDWLTDRPLHSAMLRPSMRGGVPVLSRPTRNGSARNFSASRFDGGSPALLERRLGREADDMDLVGAVLRPAAVRQTQADRLLDATAIGLQHAAEFIEVLV